MSEPITIDDIRVWLENKYARHGELEDKAALDLIVAQHAEIEQLKAELGEEYTDCASTYEDSREKVQAAKKEVDRLKAERDELAACLDELRKIVWGECPSLLNEDSGGFSELDLRIYKALGKKP